MKINVSLLREKFVIEEIRQNNSNTSLKIVAPSNRMPLYLQSGDENPEEFVVRANTMQLAIRIAAHIVGEYEQKGPLFHRLKEDSWRVLWDESLSEYERKHNPLRWACIYHNGKPVFASGKRHPFFDVIEKCDIISKSKYEDSIDMAKSAFEAAGKEVHIDYDSSIALVSELDNNGGRCGMVLRSPKHTITFNFYVKVNDGQDHYEIMNAQVLSAAAAFIEGTQLCFVIGSNKAKLTLNFIKQYSPEYMQMQEASRQIQRIETEISVMENRYQLRYRPERPIFGKLIEEAEDVTTEHLEES